MRAAFSNIRITVHDTIAKGEKVCLRWSCAMQHAGSGLGIAPSGKYVYTTAMSIMKTRGGKLAEGWQNWDMLNLLQQITGAVKVATYMVAAKTSN